MVNISLYRQNQKHTKIKTASDSKRVKQVKLQLLQLPLSLRCKKFIFISYNPLQIEKQHITNKKVVGKIIDPSLSMERGGVREGDMILTPSLLLSLSYI